MKMTVLWRAGAAMGVATLVCAALAMPALSAQSRRGDRSWSDDNDGPKETETVDRTIPVPANGTLRLKNFSGDIHVTASSGRDIVMHARRRASRPQLDHIKLDVDTTRNMVTIDANKKDQEWSNDRHNNNVVDTTFELQVPASVYLDIDAFSSDVTIEGMTGSQSLKTFSGEIHVKEPKGALTAETFSADIVVVIDAQTKGDLSFTTFSGDLDSSLAISSTSRRRRAIEGTLPGGSGPKFQFKTFSGDVQIKSR